MATMHPPPPAPVTFAPRAEALAKIHKSVDAVRGEVQSLQRIMILVHQGADSVKIPTKEVAPASVVKRPMWSMIDVMLGSASS